jgi:hypothetical protein
VADLDRFIALPPVAHEDYANSQALYQANGLLRKILKARS